LLQSVTDDDHVVGHPTALSHVALNIFRSSVLNHLKPVELRIAQSLDQLARGLYLGSLTDHGCTRFRK
jgi:hypothetical protein